MFCWLDLETTGLDPETDHVLEIGFAITDDALSVLGNRSWILPFDRSSCFHNDPISAVVLDMHEKNGLWDDCRNRAKMRDDDEKPGDPTDEIHQFLRRHLGPAGKNLLPLSGSSVSFDRGFLQAKPQFCSLLDRFSPRNIDVSSLKELAKVWAPEVYANRPRGEKRHRALSDIDDSIAELVYYRKNFLIAGESTNV